MPYEWSFCDKLQLALRSGGIDIQRATLVEQIKERVFLILTNFSVFINCTPLVSPKGVADYFSSTSMSKYVLI